MKEHFCSYNHNLSEPCGRIARFKYETKYDLRWYCATHYDEVTSVFKQFGITPENAGPTIVDDREPKDETF
jgi:hypothetical protein